MKPLDYTKEELAEALCDVLDTMRNWYEIKEQTGMPEQRCKDIEKMYQKAVKSLNR